MKKFPGNSTSHDLSASTYLMSYTWSLFFYYFKQCVREAENKKRKNQRCLSVMLSPRNYQTSHRTVSKGKRSPQTKQACVCTQSRTTGRTMQEYQTEWNWCSNKEVCLCWRSQFTLMLWYKSPGNIRYNCAVKSHLEV